MSSLYDPDEFSGRPKDASDHDPLDGQASLEDVFDQFRQLAFGPDGKSPDGKSLDASQAGQVSADLHDIALVGQLILAATDAGGQTAEEKQGAIEAADAVAGQVNNLAVVTDGDVGRLSAVRPSGGSAAEQFAAARVDGAIARAQQKLATERQARAMGDNSQYIQGSYASPEEYRAQKAKEEADRTSKT